MNASHSETPTFQHLYTAVDNNLRQSFNNFRSQVRPKEWEHEGISWRYLALGEGRTGALFLPGAAGFYDIWWQQLIALSGDLRLISISYPSIGDLEGLRSGLNAILQHEGIERFHVIGSSMGGYLAQYLASIQSSTLMSAVFANTFVPGESALRIAPLLRISIDLVPLPMLMSAFRWLSKRRLVPAGEDHPLLEAYLMETSYAGLKKGDLLSRYLCVTQRFTPCRPEDQRFPILIIDSDNDPLIRPGIRTALRQIYPRAQCHTFSQAGHFPYLNQAEVFTSLLHSFLLSPRG